MNIKINGMWNLVKCTFPEKNIPGCLERTEIQRRHKSQ